MSASKRRSSAADVLRQEMQQPLVLPNPTTTPQANPTSPINTNMSTPNDDAKLKAAAESETKMQQQIAALQAQLAEQSAKSDGLSKELKDAKDVALKLSAQGKAPAKTAAKSTAITKSDSTYSSLTARPTQSREETARRRANTDIGWLD